MAPAAVAPAKRPAPAASRPPFTPPPNDGPAILPVPVKRKKKSWLRRLFGG
jgi:hypothetical protein